MSMLQEVPIGRRSLDAFRELIGDRAADDALAAAARLRARLGERVIWNINSTAVGGGVAEMLSSLLGYVRGADIDARWLVIDGSPEFFQVTKRIHHALHGSEGDGTPLDEAARAVYESTLHHNGQELGALLQPGDFAILHDPQTAGLAPDLLEAGVHVVWRCHIGHDRSNTEVENGWRFLEPYLRRIPVFVFSREEYVPDYCDHGKSRVIQPSIDAFSPKNAAMDPDAIRTILVHTGLVEGPPPARPDHRFVRHDGSHGRVSRHADVVRLGRAPGWDTPLVVQVSRWDPLKDMAGVMQGFARLVEGGAPADAELVLAGPNVSGVADDPEGATVFEEVLEQWRALPHGVRDRVHIASLPTADAEENAAIVNALQRHAAVVVQKSFQEGFGLTVTEAMWKSRAVLASRVGGIQDQVEDGVNGLLLDDPADLDAFGARLKWLLENPAEARRLGIAARERVREHFLGVRHLLRYLDLIESELCGASSAASSLASRP